MYYCIRITIAKKKERKTFYQDVHVLESRLGERVGWHCKFIIIIHDLAIVLFMGSGGTELFFYYHYLQAKFFLSNSGFCICIKFLFSCVIVDVFVV
jgi:hypothetical protein